LGCHFDLGAKEHLPSANAGGGSDERERDDEKGTSFHDSPPEWEGEAHSPFFGERGLHVGGLWACFAVRKLQFANVGSDRRSKRAVLRPLTKMYRVGLVFVPPQPFPMSRPMVSTEARGSA
jgi:hypothetical protein